MGDITKKHSGLFFLDTVYIIIIINTVRQLAGASIAELEWMPVSIIYSFDRTRTVSDSVNQLKSR